MCRSKIKYEVMKGDHFFYVCCVNRGHDPKAMEALMKQNQTIIKYVRKMGTPILSCLFLFSIKF